MIKTEIRTECIKCHTDNDVRMYCQDCVNEIKKNQAIEIFDLLYYGDTNMIVIGETPSLQTLNYGGESILKHKYLKKFCLNYLNYFLRLAFEFTKGERGRFEHDKQEFDVKKKK